MGLGVMALGVLGALPFRHAPPPEMTAVNQMAASQLTLGDGVSLQVPGQVAVAGLQTPNLQPLPTEQEPEQPGSVDPLGSGAMVKITPPPRLPDQYQPLFPTTDSRQDGVGRVVTSADESTSSPRPLRRHSIHDGDTLTSLAQRYLGDPERANEIFEVNRSVLPNPDVLPIGVKIVIPRTRPADTRSMNPVSQNRVSQNAVSQNAVSQNAGARNLVPLPAVGFRSNR